MWLCMNNAFLSVVKDRTDPTDRTLLVRARRKAHLKRFLGRSAKIDETPHGDYRWRARVSRDKLSWIMDWHCQNLSYDNFKNSVQEKELHDMYLTWWSDHNKYQEKVTPRPPMKAASSRYAHMLRPFATNGIDEQDDPTVCPNSGLPCIKGCDRKECLGLNVPLNEWPMDGVWPKHVGEDDSRLK